MIAPAVPPCVLVTGASGVLGSAVARGFSEKGFKVLGTGCRTAPPFQPSIQLDLTLESEIRRLEPWLGSQTDHVDVLVQCVGGTRDGLISKMNTEDWSRTLAVNLKSAFMISRVLLPRMMKQRSGHLIFVGSWGGRVGRIGQANYAAAKAGLLGLTQSIAREYAARNVLANCVVPGVFKSPMTDALSPEALERLWDGAAMRQFADLGETADFIVHLASMRAVTGQVFQLDGRIAPS